MQKAFSRLFAIIVPATAMSVLSLAGCATSATNGPSTPMGPVSHTVSGSVHGGQQPVTGSTIALYAAGKSGLFSQPRSMLTSSVITDSLGNFDITGKYQCQPADQVYIVAAGGNAGSGENGSLVLMAALGPCSDLSASTFIVINEVTTVASAFALTGFMNSIQEVGADYSVPAQAHALAAAFADVKTLVDVSQGFALQTSTGNGIVPFATINSLADSMSACVNATALSPSCINLFSFTLGFHTGPPQDTTQAVINLAKAPAGNAAAIWLLAPANPPFLPTLTSAPSTYAIVVQHPSDVLTYHNDISRDGVQAAETTLTPANVGATHFGKLFTFPVDSYLFAQPLYAGGIGMPDGDVHNLVFAASTRGTVYAFDADGKNAATGNLWSVNLIPPGERYPAAADYFGCTNPPEAGIVGTPVIDRTSLTMYVVVRSVTNDGVTFFHRLHALSLLDGSEQPNSPTLINPTFATNGQGAGAVGNIIPWDGQSESQRAALLLAPDAYGRNNLWIAYASHCDLGNYHGVILGYNSSNISQLTASFNNTPNGSDGGIWLGAGGPAADANGNIYAAAGNGTFDANVGGPDFGDAVTRFAAPAPSSASTAVTVADYFTPSNQAYLQQNDLDVGGTEPILVNDPASAVAPHLLITSDKNGYIYLLNADNLGRYDTGHNGPDGKNGDLEDFGGGGTFIDNFAFFNNTLYTSVPLSSYAFTPGSGGTAGSLSATPAAQTALSYTAPVVSANGTANGIVWTEDPNGVLYAYSPDLAHALYTSNDAPNNRDTPAPYVKFTSPIIANGKVYLSGQGALVVYGPLH